MHYCGSKKKLLPFIQSTIYDLVGNDLTQLTFCDLFSGTGIVGRTFKTKAKEIIANDLEYYAYVLNRNYIGNHETIANSQRYIDELNNLPLIHNGFIFKHYCRGGGTDRQYFSNYNGKKIDTIRQGIENMWKNDDIDDDLYFFLLASFIESVDAVSNTTALYTSYLKNLTPTAQESFVLEPAHFETNANPHRVFNENANTLIKKISGDILYLDPPYTARQYGGDYHILGTLAKYDTFIPAGITGRREYQRSAWASSKSAADQLEDLLKHAQFRYTFMSYNNEGLIPPDVIENIMSKCGKYDVATTEYKRFKSSAGEHKAKSTIEYLHILEKP